MKISKEDQERIEKSSIEYGDAKYTSKISEFVQLHFTTGATHEHETQVIPLREEVEQYKIEIAEWKARFKNPEIIEHHQPVETQWKGKTFSQCSEDDKKDAIDWIKGLTKNDGEILSAFAIPWLLQSRIEEEAREWFESARLSSTGGPANPYSYTAGATHEHETQVIPLRKEFELFKTNTAFRERLSIENRDKEVAENEAMRQEVERLKSELEEERRNGRMEWERAQMKVTEKLEGSVITALDDNLYVPFDVAQNNLALLQLQLEAKDQEIESLKEGLKEPLTP